MKEGLFGIIYSTKDGCVHPYGSPTRPRHLWVSKASAEGWIKYMKTCDPWKNIPELADTLTVVPKWP